MENIKFFVPPGTAATEDRHFPSFEIVKMVWNMLREGGLHPEKCKPSICFGSLYFLKVYP